MRTRFQVVLVVLASSVVAGLFSATGAYTVAWLYGHERRYDFPVEWFGNTVGFLWVYGSYSWLVRRAREDTVIDREAIAEVRRLALAIKATRSSTEQLRLARLMKAAAARVLLGRSGG